MSGAAREAMDQTALEYPVRVLFLCNGNSARSQIAEALLAKKGGDRFIVASAGTNPVDEVRPEALAALQQIGIDWRGHRPKAIASVADEPWDLVITLCDRTRESCPSFRRRPITAHWGIPDPDAAADVHRRVSAFADTLGLLAWRIDLMLSLNPEAFSRMVYQERLRAIPHQDERSRASRRSRKDDDEIRTDL
jgi:protein-tyrosine-phosphatase